MLSKILSVAVTLFIMIIGCAPMTTGIYDSNNKLKEPFKFLFSGTPEEANRIVKRFLVEQGYIIENDDISSGFLITKPKKLNSDECYNMAYADALMMQFGIIKILYDTLGTNTICTVFPILSTDASRREDAFSKRKLNIEDSIVPQGHPLAIKIKNTILGLHKFIEYKQ